MKSLIIFSLAITFAAMPSVCIAEEWWSEGNPISTGLVGMSTEALDGKIYMFGGMFPPVPYYITTVEAYDPEADLWSLMTPMPEDRLNVSLAAVDDSIYVFGGIGGGFVKSTVWKYTPSLEGTAEGPWQTKNPIGYPVSSGTEISASRGVAVSDGKVYIFGGYCATDVVPYVYANWHPYSTIWCYDPASDMWERKTDLPLKGSFYAASYRDKIYLMGDALEGGIPSDIFWEYDPSTDTLNTTGLPPFAGGVTSGASVGMIGDAIYVAGGYNNPVTQASTWKYSFVSPEKGWVQIADMPHAANSAARATSSGSLYLFGGYSCSEASPCHLIDHTQILRLTIPAVLTGRIAFISDRDGNEEIYLMNIDGSNQIRLTNDPGVDASPVFSPDGKAIAFISNRSGSHRIYTMPWNGSEVHEVPNSECHLGYTTYCRSLAWSPDGQKLLFKPTYDSLATINLDGSNKTILLTGGVGGHNFIWGPEWGPTIDDIYFNAQPYSWGYDQHIFHYSISGNNWTQITMDVQPTCSMGAKVSIDGSRIVFFRQEQWEAGYNIFTMDLDGGNMSKITHDNSTSNSTPDWAGETGEIVFWSDKSGRNQIWLMDSTGGNLRMLEGEGNNYAPSWTPILEPEPLPVLEAVVDIAPDVFNIEVELDKETEEPEDEFLRCFIELAEGVSWVDVDASTVSLSVNETILANAESPVILDNVFEVLFRLDLANMGHILGLEVAEVEADDEKIEIKANSAPSRSIDLIELTVSGELVGGGRFSGTDAIRLMSKLDD